MTNNEFYSLISIFVCADPWPAKDEERDECVNFLNRQAVAFGYRDWIDAMHNITWEYKK